jgi:hypothetical protein
MDGSWRSRRYAVDAGLCLRPDDPVAPRGHGGCSSCRGTVGAPTPATQCPAVELVPASGRICDHARRWETERGARADLPTVEAVVEGGR